MAIIQNGNVQKAYKGDHKPINVYKGDTKMTGWKNETKSGASVSFADTYNDVADVTVEGDTVQVSDWYSKDGVLSQYSDTKVTTQLVVTDGLKLELSGRNFFNDPQTTALQDRSGNNNALTAANFSYTAASGSDGAGGIVFDGMDDKFRRVCVDDDTLDLTTALTFEAWVKPTSLTTTTKYLIAKNLYSGTADHQFAIGLIASKIEVYMGGVLALNLAYSLTVGATSHIVVAWDGTTISVYVNNVLAGNGAYSGTLPFKPNLSIGCRSSSADGLVGTLFFVGTMYSVRLYNRALTVAEVNQNYLAGTSITTPAPSDPSPVVSNLKAGTYKYTAPDGIYEFTLAEDLRGIGMALDRIAFDRVNKRMFVERKIGKTVFNGTEVWTLNYTGTHNRFFVSLPLAKPSDKNINLAPSVSTHFILLDSGATWGQNIGYTIATPNILYCTKVTMESLANFKDWLAAQSANGAPLTVYYQLATTTRTEITATKVASSSRTEVPMTFLQAFPATAPSLNYPAGVYDVSGRKVKSRNAYSSKTSESILPTLRKIGTVADSFNPLTGKHIKRISDWVALDGSLAWTPSTKGSGYLNTYFLQSLFPGMIPWSTVLSIFKNDTKKLTVGSPATAGDMCYLGTTGVSLSISDSDTGYGGATAPNASEIKAYFHGWQMCNADGSVPYYKSEVPYTASAWAEWTMAGAGTTRGSSGAHLVQDGGNERFEMLTAFKPSTKYGILHNVISQNLNGSFVLVGGGGMAPPNHIVLGKTVGNNKATFTSIASITNNAARLALETTNTDGTYIDFKDVRIFELPTGSQIEADFTNLTADQLAAKYTFNGLCVKNWKKITDGTGQTSTLPTASYVGYEPYKMIYQLATPIETTLAIEPVETFYPTTIIETDAVNAVPNLSATVKVED